MNNESFQSYLKDLETQTILACKASKAELAIPHFTLDKITKQPIIMGDIHYQIQRHIDQNQFAIVVIPRGHGKTTQISQGRTCHEIGKDIEITIKIVCENKGSAVNRALACREIIGDPHNKSSILYRQLYPNVIPSKTQWQTESFTVQREIIGKDATVTTAGADTSITGDRVDLMICDDICGKKSMTSKAHREMIIETFKNEIMNLLQEPNGRLIFIATPWHPQDLTMKLIRGEMGTLFKCLVIPIPDDMTPIWEEKWTKEGLLKRRQGMDQRAFDRGYHLKPHSDEETVFNEDDIKAAIRLGPALQQEGFNDSWFRVMAIDPAISQKTHADYTCIFILGLNPKDGAKIPLHIERKKISFPETINKAIELQSIWKCDMIRVESNQYQMALAQGLQEKSKKILPISAMPTKRGKVERASNLAVEFENRGWRIYNHQNPLSPDFEVCECGTCRLIYELINFPDLDHDDVFDGAELASSAMNEIARRPEKPKFEKMGI